MTFLHIRKEQDVDSFLTSIFKAAQHKKISLYLVGGIVRDVILNKDKESWDIDFCMARGALEFGRLCAGELRAGYVLLDKEHACCRVVKKAEGGVYTFDFSDFRDTTLEKDLLHRDFTINAMAVELQRALGNEKREACIVDPFGGRKDVKKKILRVVNAKAFDEDPLRILRAFSLSCILGFKIESRTLALIRSKRRLLEDVSSERVRDELFKILDRPDSLRYIKQLDSLKILEIVIPEIGIMRGVKQGAYHHLDVWGHTLESLKQLEILFASGSINKEIRAYLDETLSLGRKRRALLKLGILLHDIGKPKAKRRKGGRTLFHGHERIGLDMSREIGRRLKLSNVEIDALGKMVMWHLRPGYLADNEKITPRAAFRYFRDTALEGVSILLLSIADHRATRGPLTSEEDRRAHEQSTMGLIREYFRRRKEKKPARVITGDDLLRKFKLPPSPLIGDMLREIEELQAIGRITTKQEAFRCAAALMKEKHMKKD